MSRDQIQRDGRTVIRFGGLRGAGTEEILDNVTMLAVPLEDYGEDGAELLGFLEQLIPAWSQDNGNGVPANFVVDMTQRPKGVVYVPFPEDVTRLFTGVKANFIIIMETPTEGEDALRIILSGAHRYIFVDPDLSPFMPGGGEEFFLPYVLPGTPGGSELWPVPPLADSTEGGTSAVLLDLSSVYLPFPVIPGVPLPPPGRYWFGTTSQIAPTGASGSSLLTGNNTWTQEGANNFLGGFEIGRNLGGGSGETYLHFTAYDSEWNYAGRVGAIEIVNAQNIDGRPSLKMPVLRFRAFGGDNSNENVGGETGFGWIRTEVDGQEKFSFRAIDPNSSPDDQNARPLASGTPTDYGPASPRDVVNREMLEAAVSGLASGQLPYTALVTDSSYWEVSDRLEYGGENVNVHLSQTGNVIKIPNPGPGRYALFNIAFENDTGSPTTVGFTDLAGNELIANHFGNGTGGTPIPVGEISYRRFYIRGNSYGPDNLDMGNP